MNRCYCIGCGDSMRGFDFSLLDNYYTIGTNFIVRDYPNLKALVFLDSAFFVIAEDDIRNFKGEIYTVKDAVPPSFRPDNLTIVKALPFDAGYIDDDGTMIVSGRLSGLSALSVALLKGYDPVYLLGYDMQGCNYYDKNVNENVSFHRDPKCLDRFDLFKDRPIYNLNPDSCIETFPKIEFEKHLSG